jgi:RNA-directed DNA polymerase
MPPPLIGKASRRAYQAQHGRCPICEDWLLPVTDPPPTPEQWDHWLATDRKTITIVKHGGTSNDTRSRLIHTHCHRHHHTDSGSRPEPLPARTPTGLA